MNWPSQSFLKREVYCRLICDFWECKSKIRNLAWSIMKGKRVGLSGFSSWPWYSLARWPWTHHLSRLCFLNQISYVDHPRVTMRKNPSREPLRNTHNRKPAGIPFWAWSVIYNFGNSQPYIGGSWNHQWNFPSPLFHCVCVCVSVSVSVSVCASTCPRSVVPSTFRSHGL